MDGFWIFQICQVSAYASVTQGSEYGSIMPELTVLTMTELWKCLKFHRVLNMPSVLNMPGFGIWPGYDYASVTQGCEYDWISLNIP